jgi:uncharacterized membrane protein
MKSSLRSGLLGLLGGVVFGAAVVYISYAPFIYENHIDPSLIFLIGLVLFLLIEGWLIWMKKSSSTAVGLFLGVLISIAVAIVMAWGA